MAQSYDIIIQVTIKDVRVTEGRASKAQVAKAICKTVGEGMDLWGLNHGYAVTDELHDDDVDAAAHFYGPVKCRVTNPGKGGRRCNPGVRSLVAKAMK